MRRASSGAGRASPPGPNGARVVGDQLDRAIAERPATVMHGVTLPGGSTGADHLVVSAVGVTLVDSKNYFGEVEVVGYLGFASQSNPPSLKINQRAADDLIAGVIGKIAYLGQVIEEGRLDFEVPDSGALCFDDRGLARTDCREIREVQLCGPKRIAAYITRSGSLTADEIDEVANHLKRTIQASQLLRGLTP